MCAYLSPTWPYLLNKESLFNIIRNSFFLSMHILIKWPLAIPLFDQFIYKRRNILILLMWLYVRQKKKVSRKGNLFFPRYTSSVVLKPVWRLTTTHQFLDHCPVFVCEEKETSMVLQPFLFNNIFSTHTKFLLGYVTLSGTN